MRADIPTDLHFEILQLLPVKSLRRFESVSKSWQSLIHNPLFITSHLHLAARSRSRSTLITQYRKPSTLCFSNTDLPGRMLRFDYSKAQVLKEQDLSEAQKWMTRRMFWPVQVLSSSNGLLCLLTINNCVIISNMLVKDHHITLIPRISQFYYCSYGFGYDSVNDDYKVVRTESNCNRCHDSTTVYSLRRNSWSKTKHCDRIDESKKKQSFPDIGKYYFLNHDNGIEASGALNWLALYKKIDKFLLRHFILAFDLTSEEFYEVSLPDEIRKEASSPDFISWCPYTNHRVQVQLGVLRGCLSVSITQPLPQTYHEIWTVEQHNRGHTSWTKLCRIERCFVDSLTPLTYSRDEKRVLLLAEQERRFYWADLIKKQVVGCVSNPVQSNQVSRPSPYYRAAICLESLVSLNDYRKLWGRKRKRTTEKGIEKEAQALELFYIFRDEFDTFRFRY